MQYRSVSRNTAGRDLVVGDIHGQVSHLWDALQAVGFNPAVDRLFCLGDLIDRGPESPRVLELLAQPWCHSVMGNHELAAIAYASGQLDAKSYAFGFGGSWFIAMDRDEQQPFLDAFYRLPIALELETAAGLLGLVHAEVPIGMHWPALRDRIAECRTPADFDFLSDWLLWSRTRFDTADTTPVEGVRAVLCGHTPISRPLTLGNHQYLDFGAWIGRPPRTPFVIIDAATLQPAARIDA